MLDEGIAKVCKVHSALDTPTRLYMTGSVNSWIHYIDLRSANGTQKEHMDIANACKCIFVCQFPAVSEAMGWRNTQNVQNALIIHNYHRINNSTTGELTCTNISRI